MASSSEFGERIDNMVLLIDGLSPKMQRLAKINLQGLLLYLSISLDNEDNRKRIMSLSNHEVNYNLRFVDEQTSLHLAAQKGYTKIVIKLLKRKADPNLQDIHKQTPLHSATIRGHEKIVVELLNHGANPNLKDRNGTTASYLGDEKMKLLIRKTMIQINFAKFTSTVITQILLQKNLARA